MAGLLLNIEVTWFIDSRRHRRVREFRDYRRIRHFVECRDLAVVNIARYRGNLSHELKSFEFISFESANLYTKEDILLGYVVRISKLGYVVRVPKLGYVGGIAKWGYVVWIAKWGYVVYESRGYVGHVFLGYANFAMSEKVASTRLRAVRMISGTRAAPITSRTSSAWSRARSENGELPSRRRPSNSSTHTSRGTRILPVSFPSAFLRQTNEKHFFNDIFL